MSDNPFDAPTPIRTTVRVIEEDVPKLLAAMVQGWQWTQSSDIRVTGREVGWTRTTTMEFAHHQAVTGIAESGARVTNLFIRRLDGGDL